ncbi:MAG: hypothetical protein MPW15_26640 [Candidatus Manganitrophus sp.]|nr:hypothetical protein [Candidatus Manganitrophus sp.]
MMRSKIRLSLLLSLVFHVVLVLGLFSRADHDGREAEGLVVELVSLGQIESAPLRTGDSTGAPDLLPPEPAFPMGSDETFDSIEEEAQPPSEPFFNPDAESAISSRVRSGGAGDVVPGGIRSFLRSGLSSLGRMLRNLCPRSGRNQSRLSGSWPRSIDPKKNRPDQP